MYGCYDIPFNLEREDFLLAVDKADGQFIYRRECLDSKTEHILMLDQGQILVNPIEPLQMPKEFSPYLQIVLQRKLWVPPKASKAVFLKFPIEIGVYIASAEDNKLLDCFTFVKPKLTLYGDPRNGFLCKYWKSEVFPAVPETDPLKEGVIELKLTNQSTGWVQVNKAIFNAYGMKIYYTDRLVSMKAEMKIRAADTAEVEFEDTPLEAEMTKSFETYVSKKLSIQTTKFIMELGL